MKKTDPKVAKARKALATKALSKKAASKVKGGAGTTGGKRPLVPAV